MGKKKSVVLMVLLTIVIVVLCGLMLVPFPVSETDSWKPPVLRYDLSTDLGGGYYAYYYPEGVIPETEDFESGKTADDYLKVGSLYLSKDAELGIVEDGEVTQDFKDAFDAAAKAITARYESKSALGNGYSESRVSIVDNYSIRVELPMAASDQDNADVNKASATLSLFSYTGEMTLEKGTSTASELVEEMKDGATKQRSRGKAAGDGFATVKVSVPVTIQRSTGRPNRTSPPRIPAAYSPSAPRRVKPRLSRLRLSARRQ